MAKATANGVTLDLTLEESTVLLALVGSIYGSPTTRERLVTDSIHEALIAAGVPRDRDIVFSVTLEG